MSETTGMAQHEVTRTLVKSQPEVWTQCSDPGSLGRHMNGSFGEIRITRLEPEHSVAWEGEEVSGTVRIEPSAWGTRVTLTVEMADEVSILEEAASPRSVAVVEPEPAAEPQPEPAAVAEPEPEAVAEAEATADPEPVPEEAVDPPAGHAETPSPGTEPPPGIWMRLVARFRRPPAAAEPAEAELPAEKLPADEPWPEEQWPYEEVPAAEPPAAEEPAVEESVAQDPEVPSRPEPGPAVESAPRSDAAAVLTAALESLGQAHHRPFSRA